MQDLVLCRADTRVVARALTSTTENHEATHPLTCCTFTRAASTCIIAKISLLYLLYGHKLPIHKAKCYNYIHLVTQHEWHVVN